MERSLSIIVPSDNRVIEVNTQRLGPSQVLGTLATVL